MSDLNHESFQNLMVAIEDSFDVVEKGSTKNMSSKILHILNHLNFYESAIRNNCPHPALHRISIIDYRIYRSVVKRRCEQLIYQHSKKGWFRSTASNESYLRHLEWVRTILNNHFIYWEWKITENEQKLDNPLGEK